MNRGTMRNQVRINLRGSSADDLIATHINNQLNLSAQEQSLVLAGNPNPTIGYGRSSCDVASDGTSTSFPLYGVPDMHSPRDLVSSDSCPTRNIMEHQRAHMLAQYPSGRDENGKYLYYLTHSATHVYRLVITATGGTFTMAYNAGTPTSAQTYNVSASNLQTALAALSGIGTGNITVTSTVSGTYIITFTGDLASMTAAALTITTTSLTGGTATLQQYRYSVNFVKAPPTGKTFTLVYNLIVPPIPDTLAGDDLSFSVVPEQFHPAIVQHCTAVLGGHASAPQTGFATALASQLSQEAQQNAAKPISPYQIKG